MSDDHLPTVRAATAADHPALVRVWRRAVEATHTFLTPADVDAIEHEVRTAALPALAVSVAQRDDGTPIGWIGVHGDRVEALFVDPSSHRRGVGSALLAAATDGMAHVELDVNEQNPSALAFYTRHGFVRTGRSERDGRGRPFPLLHLRREPSRLPEPTDPARSAAALLLTYLDFYRSRVLDTYAGLPEPDRTGSRLPSGWSPAELLHHLRCMERRWLEWGFVDAALPDPWADHVDGRWHLPPDATSDGLTAALAAQGRRTREITEAVGPGAVGVPSERWRGARPGTIERTLLHVVQEYARHLGHLDIVAELATGAVGE
ncbi:acetyltransferase [Pseudonocardia sp. ICBG1293]|uniref:acetyltransferase n=1 Tax=Pseudonocardia sp. ICBG1293 TaxID=2844382 RepID=UPI001CCC96D7|nr:acetyltransferase [Pseudonocardia sp. ICBG1293]